MELTNRLQAIANLVKRNSIVADIGTDHGLLPNYLVDNEISKKIICTDISKASLQKSIDLTLDRKNNEKIEARVGNGLEPITKGEVTTYIIAGMGGILIAEIISKGIDKIGDSELILQPMQAPEKLRKYLVENNFTIIDEVLSKEDKRIYEIIVAKLGKPVKMKDIDFEIPRLLIEKKDPLLREFLNNKIELNLKIISDIKIQKNSYKGQERINYLINKNTIYEEILDEI